MRWFLVITYILTCKPILSAAEELRVQYLDLGHPGEETLVFFDSGKLGRFKQSDHSLLQDVSLAVQMNIPVQVKLNLRGEIQQLKLLQQSAHMSEASREKFFSEDYVPSVLASYDEARTLFYQMRKSPVNNSECWQRAHVWAYEWRLRHQVFSSKAWVFFTRKYIRANPDLNWWFHVAPLVHVNIDGEIKERVMDPKYANGPVTIKKWTDSFMRNRESCRLVDTYSDHANYQDSASCFLMKSSMYYLQPVDLELLEKFGQTRESWVEAELVQAYEQAFRIK